MTSPAEASDTQIPSDPSSAPLEAPSGVHHTSNTSEDPKSAHEPALDSTSAPSAPVPDSELAPAADLGALSEQDRDRAARALQRRWRKRQGKAKADPSARWREMNIQTRAQVNRTAAEDAKNDPASRWRRAGFIAARLNDGDALPGNEVPKDLEPVLDELAEKGKLKTKSLETQHWLEMMDGKHRYGSNLKFYFRAWVENDTEQNFFQWLDRGGGKELDLEECSRERLESERITYLSAEQRKNYLVEIDSEGRLRWARNGVLIDTRPNQWKDSEGGQGIVPIDGTEDRAVEHRMRRQVTTLSGAPSLSSSSSDSLDNMDEAQHYGGNPTHGKFKKALASRFTSKGITDRLLKKTLKKNTWIYAADAKYNLFIGMKHTGTFQHSSLTGGGLITSAGLITVKDGQITKLSPLSGHYRTSIDHFNVFCEVMEKRGADLHKVGRTKAEIALWGLSRWKTFKKAQRAFVKERKQEVKEIIHPSSPDAKAKQAAATSDPDSHAQSHPLKLPPPSSSSPPKSEEKDGTRVGQARSSTAGTNSNSAPSSSESTRYSGSTESSNGPGTDVKGDDDDSSGSWIPADWRHAAVHGRRRGNEKVEDGHGDGGGMEGSKQAAEKDAEADAGAGDGKLGERVEHGLP